MLGGHFECMNRLWKQLLFIGFNKYLKFTITVVVLTRQLIIIYFHFSRFKEENERIAGEIQLNTDDDHSQGFNNDTGNREFEGVRNDEDSLSTCIQV